MTELECLIVLNMVSGLGPLRIRKLLEAFGSASAVLKASPSALEKTPLIGAGSAGEISRWADLPYRRELALIEKLGLEVIPFSSDRYPSNLKEIYDPPPLLYVRGELCPSDRFALAVVGSRRASNYGLQAAFSLSRQMASRGFTVVSGMARGIDSQAHRGALSDQGRTIAVLGSGLGNIYPPENCDLALRIASSGALVSEFPVSTRPEKGNFPARNRVISGLALGVLVVEAGDRSGALITARQALDQGRLVMAVPGRIDSFSARGTNSLIQEGAKMVRGPEDILEEFGYLFPPPQQASPPPGLSAEEKILYSLLSEEEKGIEDLIGESGLPPGRVIAILLGLELRRLIKQLPGKYYIKSSSGR